MVSLGGAGAVSGLRTSRFRDDSLTDGSRTPLEDETLRIRVYPGPVPLHVRLRDGLDADGAGTHWTGVHEDALEAVSDAVAQILSYARERSRFEDLEWQVERGESVRLPLSAVSRPTETVSPSLETVLEGFRDRLAERNALAPTSRDATATATCHLLLSWAPFNHRLGYGGTLSPTARVGADGGDGDGSTPDALTVANVGATERWDSRPVTRNMAIHEVLHTLVSSDVAEDIGGTRCDHDLGTATRVDDATVRVSPIATAYAGPDEFGGGTRFHGTGCYDHEEFHRHDGLEGVAEWEYTTELSDATLEATTRYLETIGYS
ncbi:hypothetical protein [Natronolimnohabitans innermongolicus]|uniref:Uncharacterized protein n=1 Tax=Natronolimnohabitans innermongolicus JCM 12255 TaxID=1227499 RepID=L9X5N8_9EURY|nr:hypothetical protein [Natronolimnohabitans innermongolicus]ELY55908.1 hypothetical protein C493_10533 [Natronolimnohabitans innermongolicus JCM 12255]